MQESTFILKDYKALGTVWYIEFFGITSFETIKEIRVRMTKEIKSFQDKYSRFEESSLLNTLNREKKIIFDYDLYTMLLQGEKWRKLSSGVFDIAIKTKLESIGYGAAATNIENQEIKNREGAGVMRNKNTHISRISKVGECILWSSALQIDLGGIGKGYLIDKLAHILKEEYGLQYFLINGGGDIFVTSNNGKAVELLLEHPTEQNKYIGKVFLDNESLCVSSSFKRTWRQGNSTHNHFVDTREGSLVEAASFVIASNAADTDVLATIFALVAEDRELVSRLSLGAKAEYLTICKSEQVNATKRFKQALNTL